MSDYNYGDRRTSSPTVTIVVTATPLGGFIARLTTDGGRILGRSEHLTTPEGAYADAQHLAAAMRLVTI